MTDYERIKQEFDLSLRGLIDRIFPVGRGFFTADEADDPNRTYPGTVWVRIEGRFLLPAGPTHPLGEVGGKESHTLTVEQLAPHSHPMYFRSGATTGAYHSAPPSSSNSGLETVTNAVIHSTGQGRPFPTMPPYIARYYWERVT